MTEQTVGLRSLLELLRSQLDPGVWWPAETRFEILVGAILTQNTSWNNVEIAIANLKTASLMTAEKLSAAPPDTVAELIRPAGYYNSKTVYLHNACHWYNKNDTDAAQYTTPELRESLLAVRGIGAETADDILLYAYDRGVFIYDLYARRLLKAAGFGDFKTYQSAKQRVDPLVTAADFTVAELAELHGLIVCAGKRARQLGGWETAYPLLINGEFNR
ncbi:endonuclease III domain-containing protein [Leucobacter sp. OH1287]|uniref:endonuclease III domain-containing protein n=1 Tax=Leucobacter sp. OH1287 TaxID=2491049 RepID=UPI000F5F2A6A|nr:deoxyribonuclease [Leucobacter sp. OH1287]RRD59682.1 deoxyribonuclease [Leucobacter sp. OH1287]